MGQTLYQLSTLLGFSVLLLSWYVVFSCRRDFQVPFDGETLTSVFSLLQQACLEMAKISHNIHQRETSADKPSHLIYQKFVYNRFMWGEYASIRVRGCIGVCT